MSRGGAWGPALLTLALAGCTGEPVREQAPSASPPPPAAPRPGPPALPGADFAADARLLHRVLACAGDAPLPRELDAGVVAAHCARLQPLMDAYRQRHAQVVAPYLTRLRPAELPEAVVYPFGGGDLLSALAAYPDAAEYTTLSLELAGDPRRLAHLDAARLRASLGQIRATIGPLLTRDNSTTENLMKGQRGEIPGQLGFFLVALAVHGFEPVHARYFRVEEHGRLHYLEAAEIDAGDDATARTLRGHWAPPDFAPVFANVEIAFRPAGAGDGAPLRVHRHFGADLSDGALRKAPGLLRHLEAKGRVAAMTKAASYLLWRADFSELRGYLLGHMAFMLSDSTGIPPGLAREAGFEQETHGRFAGSFLPADPAINRQFRELWASQPARALPFRFGYVDRKLEGHLLVTRPAPARVAEARLPGS